MDNKTLFDINKALVKIKEDINNLPWNDGNVKDIFDVSIISPYKEYYKTQHIFQINISVSDNKIFQRKPDEMTLQQIEQKVLSYLLSQNKFRIKQDDQQYRIKSTIHIIDVRFEFYIVHEIPSKEKISSYSDCCC